MNTVNHRRIHLSIANCQSSVTMQVRIFDERDVRDLAQLLVTGEHANYGKREALCDTIRLEWHDLDFINSGFSDNVFATRLVSFLLKNGKFSSLLMLCEVIASANSGGEGGQKLNEIRWRIELAIPSQERARLWAELSLLALHEKEAEFYLKRAREECGRAIERSTEVVESFWFCSLPSANQVSGNQEY